MKTDHEKLEQIKAARMIIATSNIPTPEKESLKETMDMVTSELIARKSLQLVNE